MRSYISFIKKECLENIRNYKLLIMVIVFLVFGIMSPLTAKLMPTILKEFMPTGMNITIPAPSALDSWTQFYSNVGQIGLIILVIIFGGIITTEVSKGTLVNMLTKGLSRSTVLLSKYSVVSLIWTISYLLCFTVTFMYTEYFWDTTILFNVFGASLCLWLFGELLLALAILGGVLVRSSYGSLLVVGGIVVVLMILNIFPNLQEYNPIVLMGNSNALLTGVKNINDFFIPISITITMSIAAILSSIAIFNKKQI